MLRVEEHRARTELRRTFDTVAERYEASRPTYPEALVDELLELAAVPPGGRILEIGPGTGKASAALAGRGHALVGVELGRQLAELARANLARFPQAQIVVADFEQWEPSEPEEPFDAVVAFTAFHWIAPDVRYAKPARLLHEGGALAVVETKHVLPAGADPFWTEVQADFDAVVPHPDNRPPPAPEEVGDLQEEIEASGLYRDVEVRRHLWDVEYRADEYIAVLGTYSVNLALPAAQRDELFTRIHDRVTAQGHVTKTYLATLNVARRA
jgi:SAM-dependent methyltransferase